MSTANIATARPPVASGYVPRGPFIGYPPPVGYWPLGGGYGANDISPYGNHGTSYGARPIASPFGGAHYFNGEDDYVDAGNDSSFDVEKVTLSAWIKLIGLEDHSYILSNSRNCCGEYGGYNFLINRDGELELELWDGTNTKEVIGNFDFSESLNEWHHVAATFNGTYGKIYVNDSIDSEEDLSGFSIGPPSFNTVIGIMAYSAPTYYPFNGSIDEVMIYDRALSPTQIRWLFNHPTGLRQPPSVIGV